MTDEVSPIRLNFLLASKRGGYWRLANGRIQKCKGDRVERDLGPYPWTNTLPIVAACEDLDGNLVVGTYGDGVYWFDAEGKATRISKEEGLSHNSVLSLTVDREGCLWVGTNGGGLNRVRRKLFDVLERSRGSVVQSVCEDGQGGLWIGYTGNRVDHWTGERRAAVPPHPGLLPVDVNPDTLLDVKSVFVGRKQGALRRQLGSEPAPGARWDRTCFNWSMASLRRSTCRRRWTGRSRPSFRTGRAGCGWARRAGCCGLDDLKLFTTRDGLSADDVRAIAEDREGNLWIGTEGGGLNRLRDGHFTCFTKTNGLPGNSVSAVEVDTRRGVVGGDLRRPGQISAAANGLATRRRKAWPATASATCWRTGTATCGSAPTPVSCASRKRS